MTYHRDASVARAKQDVGYHEGPNNDNPYSPWQGLNRYNPWCASAVCFWAFEGGGYRFPANNTFGTKGEAYVPTMKQRAQEEGLWRDRNWRAKPGDFWLFDWGNNGLLDHVEMVVVDDGHKAVLIGGNTSDQVAYRTRDRAYLAGTYALSDSKQAEPAWKVQPMFQPTLEVNAALANPDGGAWLLRDNGTVLFVGLNGALTEGGMTSANDRRHWGGRHGARLHPRKRNGGKPGYEIEATDGARYIPEAQH